ncbi:hypothetical protein F5148DRAFT_1151176 [Russula earlei]|uniref:Uncharacterized protein n=1 Tax=Russula earlei TaxID=71964 RepID=A0ACC0U1A9_9AGAM|nr:hypothetical protein F5148DRAFT_1151176 [Russula earlei]
MITQGAGTATRFSQGAWRGDRLGWGARRHWSIQLIVAGERGGEMWKSRESFHEQDWEKENGTAGYRPGGSADYSHGVRGMMEISGDLEENWGLREMVACTEHLFSAAKVRLRKQATFMNPSRSVTDITPHPKAENLSNAGSALSTHACWILHICGPKAEERAANPVPIAGSMAYGMPLHLSGDPSNFANPAHSPLARYRIAAYHPPHPRLLTLRHLGPLVARFHIMMVREPLIINPVSRAEVVVPAKVYNRLRVRIHRVFTRH